MGESGREVAVKRFPAPIKVKDFITADAADAGELQTLL